LQTRRNHAAGNGGLAGSGIGLSLGLGTAATVAGVCAGVGGRAPTNVDSSDQVEETQTAGFDQDTDGAEDGNELRRKSENGNRNGGSRFGRSNFGSADDLDEKRFGRKSRRFETDSHGSSKCVLQ
jgi:hypothetical protein